MAFDFPKVMFHVPNAIVVVDEMHKPWRTIIEDPRNYRCPAIDWTRTITANASKFSSGEPLRFNEMHLAHENFPWSPPLSIVGATTQKTEFRFEFRRKRFASASR